MKIIHTSDWHLGQNFYNKSRKNEHQKFLDWLLDTAQHNQVNAIIVAGDIFDTSTPPSYAREMYNQFVVNAHKQGCQLVLLGGNHDSVSVLNETKQLLKHLNTDVIANSSGDYANQVVELLGPSKEVEALVCAIPFIRPRDVLTSQAGVLGSERQKQLGEAIKGHYLAMYQAAVNRKQQLEQAGGKVVPIIATGHLTALGVSQSESVRDIYIGNLDGFAADGFPPADYIALGHIHRPQKVGGKEHIRYSGSPIPLSFDELKSTKQVVMVEFEGTQPTITPIEVPTFQPLGVVKGDLNDIESQLNIYQGVEEGQSVWLSVEVTHQDYLTDLQERMRKLTSELNVEVLQLKRAREARTATMTQQSNETLSELSPFEVFEKRLGLESFESEQDKERLNRISDIFKTVAADVAQGTEQE